MEFKVLELLEDWRPQCLAIFNGIIEEGLAFPWDKPWTMTEFDAYYVPEQPVWCAVTSGDLPVSPDKKVLGFVHIKPNGVGRLAHVANCGYNISPEARGKGIGKALVAKAIEVARDMGYVGMQYNAVVSTNTIAIKLYESFGFSIIGTVPQGFRLGSKDNPHYVNHHIMYLVL